MVKPSKKTPDAQPKKLGLPPTSKSKKVAADRAPKPVPKHSKPSKSKVAAKAPSPSPEPSSPSLASEDDNNNDEGGGDDDDNASSLDDKPNNDENDHLHGFSTDEEDSSDDDDDVEPAAVDVGKLPTIAKDDAVVKQRLDKAKRKPTDQRGVLYLSRIPHGFYEDQLKSYFSQFGDVTRLRLSRNKKTGRSKHYAFIEFDSLPVAQIVAETMDNYLLMGHILKCKLIPKEDVHPNLWIGANRKWRVVPYDRIARVKHNKPRTDLEMRKSEKRLIKRQKDRKRRLVETGIKYDFESVAYKKRKASVET